MSVQSVRSVSWRNAVPFAIRVPRVTRRTVQVGLGLLWLLDGALQFQPFMFGRGFATQVIAPAAAGQPGWVHALVMANAHLIAREPVLFNLSFALIQTALGIGLLVGRTAGIAAPASVAWALGVWSVGEGFGGVFGGHITLLTGAPGAALIYAILGAAAWPRAGSGSMLPSWLRHAWLAVWGCCAVLLVLPWQATGRAVASSLTDAAGSLPRPLASLTRTIAKYTASHGVEVVGLLLVVQLAIAVTAYGPRRIRLAGAAAGGLLALLVWISAEGLGQLTTGQATDPNSGPLLILLAIVTAACVSDRQDRRPQRHGETPPEQGETLLEWLNNLDNRVLGKPTRQAVRAAP